MSAMGGKRSLAPNGDGVFGRTPTVCLAAAIDPLRTFRRPGTLLDRDEDRWALNEPSPTDSHACRTGDAIIMPSFKDPSFQDRVGQSSDAKEKALEQLRQRPPRDPKIVAERKAAGQRREAAKAQKVAAKNAAAAAARAAAPPPLSEADRKAARDARYAARKNRK